MMFGSMLLQGGSVRPVLSHAMLAYGGPRDTGCHYFNCSGQRNEVDDTEGIMKCLCPAELLIFY